MENISPTIITNPKKGDSKQGSNKKLVELKRRILKESIKYCDRCGAKYAPDNIDVQVFRNRKAVVVYKCPQCGSVHMVNVNLQSPSVKGPKPVEKTDFFTDVTLEEMVHLIRSGGMNYKQIIQVLKKLRNKQTTVRSLVRRLED